jgi:hypothetical protein
MNQNPLHRTLWVLWGAMIFSVALYGVIARVAVPEQNKQPLSEALENVVVLTLYGIGVLSFLLGIWIPRLLQKSSEPGIMPSMGPDASLTPRLMPAFTVQYAIFESVAIYGLIAAFLQQDWRLFIGPAALSIAGFLIAAPTEERIRNFAR